MGISNFQILHRFIKNNDLLKNEKIYKQHKRLMPRLKEGTGDISLGCLCSFFDNCCGWGSSKEGRIYWERLHGNLLKYILQYVDNGKIEYDRFSIGYFSTIKDEDESLYNEIVDILTKHPRGITNIDYNERIRE